MGASSGAKVVKSSGETEVFDPNIITSDCVEAGVEFWTAAEVALEVSKDIFDGINSDEIQRKIMSALYTRNPEVAERYKRFHSMYVRTSNNTIERFDRKRIVNSLVKETTLPKEVAEIVARETEVELRRLNLDFTSGPLIREIVNVKLLEHGYEGARSDYTRLGMPVYDAAQFIESPPGAGGRSVNPEAIHREMANSIFREYSLLKVLPLHLADSHMKGDLHIHGLEYFVTRPYTAIHDLRFFLKNGVAFDDSGPVGSVAGPPRNAYTAVLQALKALMAFSSSFSSSQGFHSFNVWLAPYLEGLEQTDIIQLAQMCLFEIAQTSPLSGHDTAPVDLEIEYGIPEPMKDLPAVLPGGRITDGVYYRDFEDEAQEFARILTDVYSKGDFTGSAFDSPRLIYKMRSEFEAKEGYGDFMLAVHEAAAKERTINLLNLATSHLGPLSSAHSSGITFQEDDRATSDLRTNSLKHSSLQCVTLNLPRAAYISGRNEEKLFEVLDELIQQTREVAMVKKDVISKRIELGSLPFLSQNAERGPYFDLDRASNLIGYVGLNEAVKTHLGDEMHEDTYARDFGVSVIRHMSDSLNELSQESGMSWLLTAIESPSVAERFAMLDSGQFSEVAFVKGDSHKNIHYTSSCHAAPEARLPLSKRQEILGPFYSINTGGMTETIEVKKRTADELLMVTKEMLKACSGHWSFAS
jgi:ribonucleoside-triphosphate reductase